MPALLTTKNGWLHFDILGKSAVSMYVRTLCADTSITCASARWSLWVPAKRWNMASLKDSGNAQILIL